MASPRPATSGLLHKIRGSPRVFHACRRQDARPALHHHHAHPRSPHRALHIALLIALRCMVGLSAFGGSSDPPRIGTGSFPRARFTHWDAPEKIDGILIFRDATHLERRYFGPGPPCTPKHFRRHRLARDPYPGACAHGKGAGMERATACDPIPEQEPIIPKEPAHTHRTATEQNGQATTKPIRHGQDRQLQRGEPVRPAQGPLLHGLTEPIQRST